MSKSLVFLTIPGLREQDLASMPQLRNLVAGGSQSAVRHGFPAVTWPSQTAMLTGKRPCDHGVTANGFYWRDEHRVEMWTAWNEKILAPQLWDVLHDHDPPRTSLAWFPMLSKGSGADYVCMPAPIHQPDGSEDLWCYTKPQEFYGDLLESRGHFPLQHFWGPLANINSSRWIAESAGDAFERFRPEFSYIYLPHLDYAAQKLGPDSDQASAAVEELDSVIGALGNRLQSIAGDDELTWLIVSEYTITPVDHVTYPNRILRDAGLLKRVREDEGDGELVDFQTSDAWALVDHQFSHIYVRDGDASIANRVGELFGGHEGIDEVLVGDARARYGMDHERSGEVILMSTPNSWQAYYWWLDDSRAPSFARTVDIHRKPGYDPVELHFDPATRSIPLNAELIKGSHGAPSRNADQMGVALCSQGEALPEDLLDDVSIFDVVMRLMK